MRILEYNLDADFVDQQNKILASIKGEELKPLIGKWFQTDKLNIVLVGDKEKVMPALKETGFEIVELDTDGKRVNADGESL